MNVNITITLIFLFLVVWEYYSPKVKEVKFEIRWPANYMLSFLTLAITSYVLYQSKPEVEAASQISTSAFLSVLKVTAIFLLLDLLLYLLHRTAHYYKVLWRFHCVHHSDPCFDLSTNFRHHPVELIWVMLVVSQIVTIFSIDVAIVGVYSLLATLIQMWHHSNTSLSIKIELALSKVLITPSVHIIHHSIDSKESNHNFGTIFSFWDRWLNTFQAPCYTNELFKLGAKGFSDDHQQSLASLLSQPFQIRPK